MRAVRVHERDTGLDGLVVEDAANPHMAENEVIVKVHAAGGGVGSVAVQLAREAGARVIATGRARDRTTALELGAEVFVDMESERFEEAGSADLVFDTIGGETLDRSAAVVRPGGALVTIAAPPTVRPADARAMFFIVEPDRDQLVELAERVRGGRLRPLVGAVRPLEETREAFKAKAGIPGKIVIRVA